MLQQWFDNFKDLADLQAQMEMAKWSWWVVVLSGISCALSLGALIGLFASLRQTKKAINTSMVTAADARELGETQARAYLHIQSIKCGPDYVLAVVVNTGETPATSYFVGAKAFKSEMGSISQSLDHGLYQMKEWQALPAKENTTVKIELSEGAHLLQENITVVRENYAKQIVSPWEKEDRLVICGKVVYGDVFGAFFETAFAFYATSSESTFLKPTHSLPAYSRITGRPIMASGLTF